MAKASNNELKMKSVSYISSLAGAISVMAYQYGWQLA
jgi:hypothetical protein